MKDIYNNPPSLPVGMLEAIENNNIEEYFSTIPQVAQDYLKSKHLDKIDYDKFSDIRSVRE